jgi:VWFA-related protein
MDDVHCMNKRILAWCAVFVFLPVAAYTQQAETVPQAGQPALKLRPAPAPEEGRIHLYVVVTDKRGKPVSGLELKDFTLLDNKQPTKIVSFEAIDGSAEHVDPPAEVILLLDAVNLGYLTLAQTRDEVAKFLRENGGHLAAPVSVALFTDEGVKRLFGPSTDGNALAAQLDQAKETLRTIGRSGGVNGASELFNLSVQWLGMVAHSEALDPRRKLLIWVGPGWPMLTGPGIHTSPSGQRRLFYDAVEISTALREAHVTLYSVSFGYPDAGGDFYESFLKGIKTADRMESANLTLKVIATQSGGQVLFPDNDLAAQIRTCVQDASAFYTLSFNPPKTDHADDYHDLQVVIDKPRLTARTDTGYYNQP